MMNIVEIMQGDSPLVLGLPHTGTKIPEIISDRLNANGKKLADTDWHIHRLYDGLLDNVTSVRSLTHRYVIDANRDPKGNSLYPGQNTTELCPTTDFDGKPIYSEGLKPDRDEIAHRTLKFHQPYHEALEREVKRIHAKFGFVILYDCHSIRSEIPYLFDATLPDFNIGTNDGQSCHPTISAICHDACNNADGYTNVMNGRFKGGWTTRHYADPENGFHTIQMELAQSTYMIENPPWNYKTDKADRLRSHLKTILASIANWRPK